MPLVRSKAEPCIKTLLLTPVNRRATREISLPSTGTCRYFSVPDQPDFTSTPSISRLRHVLLAHSSFYTPVAIPLQSNSSMPMSLLALPAEFRQRVWFYHFQGSAIRRAYRSSQRHCYRERACTASEDEQRGSQAQQSILLTCKTIHREALMLYYQAAIFRYSFCELVNTPIPSAQLFNARTVHLDVYCTQHTDGTFFGEDIVPRLQQFYRLDRLYLTPLTQSAYWGADCCKSDATDDDMLSTLTQHYTYGCLWGWMIDAMPHTRIYPYVKGSSGDNWHEIDTVSLDVPIRCCS